MVERRDTLKSWTILLAIITFSLSLVGTFLVRSGVLSSVHAFAVDPLRGIFILMLLILAIGGSLTLYAIRAPALQAVNGTGGGAPGSITRSTLWPAHAATSAACEPGPEMSMRNCGAVGSQLVSWARATAA